MALAVSPSLMSSFFSQAPGLLPPLSLKQLNLRLCGHCASLSSSPRPLLSQTFWFEWSLSFYPKSPSRFSQQRGPRFCSIPHSEDESRTVGIPGAPGRETAWTGCAACVGVSAYWSVARVAPVRPQQRKILLQTQQPLSNLAFSLCRSPRPSSPLLFSLWNPLRTQNWLHSLHLRSLLIPWG